jgi:quercetin dioxygenase-like cupin family protein
MIARSILLTVWIGLLAAGASHAQEATATRLYSATTSALGQPITLPAGNAEVVVWMYEIPAGARLPVHKHPFPRYAYVLAGTLQVSTADDARTWTYKAGDFLIEMIDAWHYGTNIGTEPVRLLVIDQVEQGRSNTVLQQ